MSVSNIIHINEIITFELITQTYSFRIMKFEIEISGITEME